MGLKRKKHHCRYIQAGCRTPQILIQVIPLKWGIGGGFGTGKLSVIIGPISIVLYYGRAPILEIETHNKMFWPFHKESFGKGREGMLYLLVFMSIPIGQPAKVTEVDHIVIDHVYSEDWSDFRYRLVWLVNFDKGDMVCHGYILMAPGQHLDRENGKYVYRFRKVFSNDRKFYEIHAFTYKEVSSNGDMENTMRAGKPQYFRLRAK